MTRAALTIDKGFAMPDEDMPESGWTAERIATLASLWAEGLSGSEIGRRMGIGKGAVIGKVHRLKLPGRVGPVRLYPSQQPGVVVSRPTVLDVERIAQQQPELLDRRRRAFAVLPRARGQACQFPLWPDERPTHRYCGHDRVKGRPYCAEHCAVAYLIDAPPTEDHSHVRP